MTLLELIDQLINLPSKKNKTPLIIDGGCNVGQFAQQVAKGFPKAQILAFEPDPESSKAARKNLANHKNFSLVEAALGPTKSKAEFHRGPISETNSLLPRPQSELKPYYPEIASLEGGTFVDVVSIDDECSNRGIEQIDLLKLDLQGGELGALEGARKMLESGSIKVVMSESVFVKKYQDQPLLWQLWQYLEQFGYTLYCLSDVKIGLYDSKEVSLRNIQWNQCDTIFLSPEIRALMDAQA